MSKSTIWFGNNSGLAVPADGDVLVHISNSAAYDLAPGEVVILSVILSGHGLVAVPGDTLNQFSPPQLFVEGAIQIRLGAYKVPPTGADISVQVVHATTPMAATVILERTQKVTVS